MERLRHMVHFRLLLLPASRIRKKMNFILNVINNSAARFKKICKNKSSPPRRYRLSPQNGVLTPRTLLNANKIFKITPYRKCLDWEPRRGENGMRVLISNFVVSGYSELVAYQCFLYISFSSTK